MVDAVRAHRRLLMAARASGHKKSKAPVTGYTKYYSAQQANPEGPTVPVSYSYVCTHSLLLLKAAKSPHDPASMLTGHLPDCIAMV